MARKREFNDATRRRIRDAAASCDLSDEEIKPVLKLKYDAVGRFCEVHGVNLEWLLEGKGRIFTKDPIALNPNMTGSEFAAVVATMPMARCCSRSTTNETPAPIGKEAQPAAAGVSRQRRLKVH